MLTEREGKSIGLAFFLVVAIKSNLSTFAGAKVRIILDAASPHPKLFRQFLERLLNTQILLLQGLDNEAAVHRPFHQVGADVGVALWLEDPVVAFHALHLAHLRDATQ